MALSAEERNSIEEELVKTKAMASGVVETIAVVNDVMAQLRDQSYETMAEVRSAADLLILEVRSREEELIEKVTEILEWKEASLLQQKKALEDFLAELQQSIDYTSDILNTPDNQDIGEWKTALAAQLQYLQNMKDEYICKPDNDDGIGFVFLYDNEQLLNSIANYGSVVDNVKQNYDRKDGKGMSGIPVIPVITLNGLIVDLVEEEKKNYNDRGTDSSDDDDDDDDDDESDDEESGTGSSDNDDDDDENDDDINSKDIPLTIENKTVRKTNDDYVNLKKNDNASDDYPKIEQKNDSDKQKIGKTMVSTNTNKAQKLSTLL